MVSQEILKKPAITVKMILEYFWSVYVSLNKVEDYQIKEVEKALNCYGSDNGCFVLYCQRCDMYVFQYYGCNSRLYSCCGKRYADNWAKSLSKSMFPVVHRHIVVSIPRSLWDFLKEKDRWKDYMDCARTTFHNHLPKMFEKMMRRTRKLEIGMICVLHPFGKDMKFHPHLHLLITEGGFDSKGKFHRIKFFPAIGLRKSWQYVILTKFRELGLPNTIVSQMYEEYQKGFYVWVHKRGRIKHPRLVARYVGRYVRHPAIANKRITYFQGDEVRFYYDQEGELIDVFMTVEQFVTALIQHIPPPNFKMVRYYLAYSRRSKRKFGAWLQSDIKQLTLYKFGLVKDCLCPKCRELLRYVVYLKKPPPDNANDLRKWIDNNIEKYDRRESI
jgi:hypothetical protein